MEVQQISDESRRRLVTFCHVVHPARQLRPGNSAPEPAHDGSRHDEATSEPSAGVSQTFAER
jgi:hypothetical protein